MTTQSSNVEMFSEDETRSVEMQCDSSELSYANEKPEVVRKGLKTLICKLWNFKMLTLDLNEGDSKKDDGTVLRKLKQQISEKISKLFLTSSSRVLPLDLFRLVQGGKALASNSDLQLD